MNAGLNVGSNLHSEKSLYILPLINPNVAVTLYGTVAAWCHREKA